MNHQLAHTNTKNNLAIITQQIPQLLAVGFMLFVSMSSTANATTTVSWPDPATDREAYSSYTNVTEGGATSAYNWGVLSIWDISALGGQTFSFCLQKGIGGGWDTSFAVTAGLSSAGFSSSRIEAIDLLVSNTMPTFLGLRDTYLSTLSTYGTADKTAANNYALAIQLAVWEIAEETSTTLSLSSGSGSFYLPGASASFPYNNAAADSLAIGFINNITSGTWTATGAYQLNYADSAFKQDQLLLTSAVPEPSNLAMLLVGFATIGFVSRRKKSSNNQDRTGLV
ncbi:MAG: PEP-CTERM sorting domain-containing protein [Methylophilaceae bacterium]|nr:PEP-CTERM sorting domain-containing protein [Methyloradius sp.]